MFFLPISEFTISGITHSYGLLGIRNISTGITTTSMSSILVAVSVVSIAFDCIATIFLYKNRKFQIFLTRITLLAIIIQIVGIFFLNDHVVKGFNSANPSVTYSFSCIIPLIALVLTFLANRAIRKDEELIRAADRIR